MMEAFNKVNPQTHKTGNSKMDIAKFKRQNRRQRDTFKELNIKDMQDPDGDKSETILVRSK